MSTQTDSGGTRRSLSCHHKMRDDELQAMLATIHEFLADARSEKQLIGYVDDVTRRLLQKFRAQCAPIVAKFDDSQRRTHEINRAILATADGTDLSYRLCTPDDNPEIVPALAARAVAAEIQRQIDRLLSSAR